MKSNSILVAALLGAFVTSAFAAEEPKHKDAKKEHPKVEVSIPATADALWSEIGSKTKELENLVNSKNEAGIHTVAETVEALVSAVPAKYADLDNEKKKRVEGMAKTIGQTLDALHEESEQGHWDGATKKLGQIQVALKLIQQQVGK